MKPPLRTLLAATAALSMAGPLAAQLLNGGFSSGLAGWSSLGDVTVNAGSAAFLTTASLGEDDSGAAAGAYNYSGTAAAAVGVTGGVEDFSGLVLGALDPDAASGIAAFEGSALRQSFAVNAGDILTFNYRLFTNDTAPAVAYADYAFFTVNNTVLALADLFSATAPSDRFARESGLATASYVFSASGEVTVSVGIVDVGDFVTTSALAVSNFSVIPEPASGAAVIGVLTLGLAFFRRRRPSSPALQNPQ